MVGNKMNIGYKIIDSHINDDGVRVIDKVDTIECSIDEETYKELNKYQTTRLQRGKSSELN